MKIGDWDLTRDEVEDIDCLEITQEQAYELAGLESATELFNALDHAQGEVRSKDKPQYILIRVG